MAPNDEAQLWLFVVSVLAFIIWSVHFELARRQWRRDRTARSFQVWYVATMIEALFVSSVLFRASRVWPDVEWVQILAYVSAPILAWMLLSGGVVALWTWSRPDRRW